MPATLPAPPACQAPPVHSQPPLLLPSSCLCFPDGESTSSRSNPSRLFLGTTSPRSQPILTLTQHLHRLRKLSPPNISKPTTFLRLRSMHVIWGSSKNAVWFSGDSPWNSAFLTLPQAMLRFQHVDTPADKKLDDDTTSRCYHMGRRARLGILLGWLEYILK